MIKIFRYFAQYYLLKLGLFINNIFERISRLSLCFRLKICKWFKCELIKKMLAIKIIVMCVFETVK